MQAVPAGLYQQLGGAATVSAILEAWCRKAQADWRVRRFLEGSQDEAVRTSMVRMLAVYNKLAFFKELGMCFNWCLQQHSHCWQ